MTSQQTRSVFSLFPHRSTNEPLSLEAVIAAARKAESWSLQKFGEEIGTQRVGGKPVSPQFLNDVEHDRRMPSEDLLDAMALVLRLDGEELRAVGRMPLGAVQDYLQHFPDQAPAVIRFFVQAQQRGFTDWDHLSTRLEGE